VLGPVDAARGQGFAHTYAGKPYVWGGCAPSGSDCSGFMSILINVVQGERDVYVRLFATGNWASRYEALGFRTGLGDSGDFQLGFIYPWESSSGIGHVAGTLDGLNVESRGGMGALVGATARGATSPLFRHHFHLPIAATAEPPKEWWQMSIPATELAKIKGAVGEALATGPGQEALRNALRYVFKLNDRMGNPFGTNSNDGVFVTLVGAVQQAANAHASMATLLAQGLSVDPAALSAVLKEAVATAVHEAMAAHPVDFDAADVRAVAEAAATIAGQRLSQPAPPA
jgi:hypothetical protein